MRLGQGRTVLGATAVAVVALALPAASQADSLQLTTLKPVGVNKHFALTLTAVDGSKATPGVVPAQPDEATFSVTRRSETASYTFRSGITFKGNKNLSKGSLKGTLVKHRGRVAMTFKATGKKHKVALPKGCTGTPGTARNGTLKGKFRLKADHLGTIRLKHVRAMLENPGQITDCSGGGTGGGGNHGTTFDASKSTKSSNVDFFAFKPRKGKLQESITVAKFGKSYVFDYFITKTGARSAYKASSDLKTATLKGIGPIGGVAKYKGKADSVDHTSGKAGGSLVAHFRTLGDFKPFKKGKYRASQGKF